MALQLRPYQLAAVERLREGIRAGKMRQVLKLPTGAGKTLCAMHLIHSSQEKGKRALFLCDGLELLDQTSTRFDSEAIPHGIMQANHWRTRAYEPVQIATIQTLVRRDMPEFDLLIADEVHRGGDRLNKLIKDVRVPCIGLTATPFTRGMGLTWDSLVTSATMQQLIDDGFLVPPQVWAPSEPDLEGVKVVAGEWKEDELAERCDTPDLVGDIVATWLTKGENRQTICFAVDVAHSKHIVEQFRTSGVDAVHIDGYMSPEMRRPLVERFRRGEIKLISNVGVLDRGFDVPEAGCLIYARPVRSSLALYVQMGGRVLRPHPGKKDAIILDHAGNTIRHGFLTDPQPDVLDMGGHQKREYKPKTKEPKKCPKCSYLRPANLQQCPMCGHQPQRQNEIFHEGGELAKIEKTQDKRVLYGEILYVQRQRGYSSGWVAHTYRKFTGVWPRGMDDVEPRPPTSYTQRRIRSLMIAYAKSREKAA